MLKSIKVKLATYNRLDAIREKDDTYSDVIERLLKAYEQLITIIEPKRN